MGSRRRRQAITPLIAVALLVAGCGTDDDATGAATNDTIAAGDTGSDGVATETPSGVDCLVRLHGKGGDGGPGGVQDGLSIVEPSGNAEGWGARQWAYAEPSDYEEARDIVAAAANGAGCNAVVVHGFSNGASMVAALYCRGEDLDRTVVGYIVDDPVTDLSSADCAPADGVEAALYWTGALTEAAPPGTDCASIDWTCEGPAVRGIDAYAADLGVAAKDSINEEHAWYLDPPEIEAWLGR